MFRLILCLAVFAPLFALLGAFVTLDTGEPAWIGLGSGAVVGVFFGCLFGGARWAGRMLGLEEDSSHDNQ
jgi:hypothetical protein